MRHISAMNSEKKAPKSDVAKREEEILEFWNKNKIFEKTQEKDAPKGEFIFYDGPPFATGLPHYGHILAGTIKDAIPRYKTMRGYRVPRRWGWDCHGLPLENEIEKELGLKTKRDIEELGIAKFNEAARKAVLRYADDWKRIVPRLGRWVDMDNDYRTMDTTYTESVWWSFKTLYDKGLIYKGFKSMHLCPRCGTTLSNFEVNQGYKDVTDFAVTVKLPLEEEKNTFLLVWTTTAWTLPGNMAAAVNKGETYTKIKIGNEYFILAKKRLEAVQEAYEVVEEFSGAELVGKRYIPPFDYYRSVDTDGKENAWKVYHAPYVSMEEGTGLVHLAPAFGEEDMELAKENDIPLVHHVETDGKFKSEVKDFVGLSVKPIEDPTQTDLEIIKNLAHRNLLFKKEKITHSYPHCWRCDTPLLNYAADSWFVKVADIKGKLVAENKKIHWVPKEVGENRFGNWLEGARDWAISRARYWGAPLPVWRNEKTGKFFVAGSITDLKKRIKVSGNRYFVMRHGEAESNVKGVSSTTLEESNPLTERGIKEVKDTAERLLNKKIDIIITSPFERAKASADIIAKRCNLSKESIVRDDRIGEIKLGELNGVSISEYHMFLGKGADWPDKKPKGGESWREVKKRVGEFLYELEEEYKNKTVLIVAHNSPLRMLETIAQGSALGNVFDHDKQGQLFERGEVRGLDFAPLPHNADHELDLHRPYIDEIELVDEDGEKLTRVPDVFDCWYESGSMPYGQKHYPFESTDTFEPNPGLFRKSRGYPADFIAEGLDQTRGWFYSLIVLGTALFGKSSYKNVIVNGTVLAEDGQKMSKRLKNYPDPMEVVDRYGADAVRFYLLSSPVVRGEDFNFSEKGVDEVMKKNILRLSNVLSFYKLYEDQSIIPTDTSKNVLDRWILSRFSELTKDVTSAMESYELDKATRPIAPFIDDLSTWYLRRSRGRFKGSDANDKTQALATTRLVLQELSKIIAPFTPFFAEHLYQEVKTNEDTESIHLTEWPEETPINTELATQMHNVRNLISLALEERAQAGIKVRQPLQTLSVRQTFPTELESLIKDEVNIKNVRVDRNLKEEVHLNTEITPELKEEGIVRDFTRFVQDLRKKERLTPENRITLVIETDQKAKDLLEKYVREIQRVVLADSVQWKKTEGENTRIGEYEFKVSFLGMPRSHSRLH